LNNPQGEMTAPSPSAGERKQIINDFNIRVATVNGSGSQSANMVLLRSIFQMGVPVSGKNLLPSNIAGLPTWFTIRASKDGYAARKAETDFAVALNPQTAKQDELAVLPGGAILADEALGLKERRSDITYYEAPFSRLAAEVTQDSRIRKLLTNMIYVGIMANLLSLDMGEVEYVIRKTFRNKANATELNLKSVRAGFEFAAANLVKTDPFRIERMTENLGKMIIDGNRAAALGAMFGGCTVATWYPITPSTSLIEALADYMERYRIDEKTGKATFAIVQAEDELAAIGIVVGAGWAGARAMTSTSGPGTSLMAEFAGFAYFAEVPAVIWDIQRIGPATGLPTRTSQGDILSCHFLSHGDTKHILLIPGTTEECFVFAQEAFNIAERFQTLVFCMSDLDLGMNSWVTDEFQYSDLVPIDRGKVLSEEELGAIQKFSRYQDVEGDGIPFRTLPGNNHPKAPYFTRGSGHDTEAQYTERPEAYVNLMERLARKIQGSWQALPQPVVDGNVSAVGIIAYGSTHHAINECRAQLRLEHGIETDYLRIRALPFSLEIEAFLERHEDIYVVEQNRDAQMRSILSIEYPNLSSRLHSVLHYTGLPIDARFITDSIVKMENKGN
jgi:2-oxoglutarate ferredoxin oxidoreductase subunit alpha